MCGSVPKTFRISGRIVVTIGLAAGPATEVPGGLNERPGVGNGMSGWS